MKQTLIIFGLLAVSGIASTAFADSSSTSGTTQPSQTVEATVREYFADIPVMIEVARCESKFRQFADSGNVLRGGVGGQMIGVYQFFDRYHVGPASALGFDIETLEGNLDYARHTYAQEGTAPWNSARDCWDVIPAITDSADEIARTSVTLTDQQLREQIALLRQIIELLQTLLAFRLGTN